MLSARIAAPAYSIAWPVPPAVPIFAMMASTMSLAVTPAGAVPSTVMRNVFGFFCHRHCVASICFSCDAPMPTAISAERAVRRRVRVAARDDEPRLGDAELRADHVHDALLRVLEAVNNR